MFSLHWNPTHLILAALAALLFDLYCSWLLHLRYGRQFGPGFIGSGFLTFSLPALAIIGVPVFLILASGLEPGDQGLMLGAMALCCAWTGWRLRHRLLSKVFTSEDVLALQNRALQQREAEQEQARLAALEQDSGPAQP